MVDYLMRTSEYSFFERYFDAHCVFEPNPDDDYITFPCFENICSESGKFNQTNLKLFLERIKRQCIEKLRNKNDKIQIDRHDFFGYLEEVVVVNNRTENENDPELKFIFGMLAGEDGEIDRRSFVNLINSFEMLIKVEDLLGPLMKRDRFGFFEFCGLFKKKTDESSLLFSTFCSSFYNTRENVKKGKKDDFPIKFNVRGEDD